VNSTASRLLVSARSSAGLTQRDLARRARTSQSVIARIESGATSPSWKTLERLLKCAGFELQAVLRPRPLLRPRLGLKPTAAFQRGTRNRSHMLDDVARILRLTPEQRLLELRNAARFFAAAKRKADDRRV